MTTQINLTMAEVAEFYQKMRFLLSVLMTSFPFIDLVHADCPSANVEFNARLNNLVANYRTISKEEFMEINRPTWRCGTRDEAVYLLHGFIGSPDEMSSLAEALSARGYTVVNDIIPGHGVNAQIGNSYGNVSWQRYVAKNVNILRRLYSRVHFVGFSTGALLIHQYLRQNSHFFKPASVTFYSPFYKPKSDFEVLLNTALKNFVSQVSISHLYFITRFPDIKIATIKTATYMQDLPLEMASEVVALGEKVRNASAAETRVKISAPTLVFLSMSDKIVAADDSRSAIEIDFDRARFEIFNRDGVPHHLMVPEVSPVAAKVMAATLEHIGGSLP